MRREKARRVSVENSSKCFFLCKGEGTDVVLLDVGVAQGHGLFLCVHM